MSTTTVNPPLARAAMPRSPAQLALARFIHRPVAVAGLAVILLFIGVAILAPLIAPYDPIATSWSAIRQDDELREFFKSVCRRHPRGVGPRVAIVAVARKLSARIAAVLMEQRLYVVRQKVHSAPLTQEETSPQGTTR